MIPLLRPLICLAVPLALAACGGNENKAEGQRTAAGEVLPGSISDGMVPYDTLRSQPPLAPKPTGTAAAKGSAEDVVDGPDPGPGEYLGPVDAPAAPPVEAPAAPASPAQ